MADDFDKNPRYKGLRARQARNRQQNEPEEPAQSAAPSPANSAMMKPEEKEPVYAQPSTPEIKVVIEKPIYVPDPAPKKEEVAPANPVKEKPAPGTENVPVTTEQPAPISPAEPMKAKASEPVHEVEKKKEPEAMAEVSQPAPEPVLPPLAPKPHDPLPVLASQQVGGTPAPLRAPKPTSPTFQKDSIILPPPDYKINHRRVLLGILLGILVLLGIAGGFFVYRFYTKSTFLLGELVYETVAQGVPDRLLYYLAAGSGFAGLLAIPSLFFALLKSKKEHGKMMAGFVAAIVSLVLELAVLGLDGFFVYRSFAELKAAVTSFSFFLHYDALALLFYVISLLLTIIVLCVYGACRKDAFRKEKGQDDSKETILREREQMGVGLAEEKKEAPVFERPKPILGAHSYFDGKLHQLIGLALLDFFVSLITLSLAFPWLYCGRIRWQNKHTVYDGYRLGFDGKGSQLIGNWLKWLLLSIITLTIYAWWIPIKLTQWRCKHTYLFRDPKGV